jgi:serine protease Do
MKSTITTIVTTVIVSLITLRGVGTFGLPWTSHDYLGELTKTTKTHVIQEHVEEYTKTSNLESDITKAIETASPSVVNIVASKDIQTYLQDPFSTFQPTAPTSSTKKQKVKVGGWSGIIISKDGYVITNKHVINDDQAEYTVITDNGNIYTTEKVRRDPVLDIAILKILDKNKKIPNDLTPAQFVSLNTPINIWQFVVTIGNTITEFPNSASFGIISAKNRSLTSQDPSYIGLYQTDAKTNPGNSGWPALTTNGEVIGLTTANNLWIDMSFILPVTREYIQASLASLTTGGSITRPSIGIQTSMLSKAAAKALGLTKFEGIMIQSVSMNSPAARAGLQSGDIITDLNGASIQGSLPFMYSLYTYKVWDTMNLVIYRDKDYKKVAVDLTGANSQ